jgi:hypothetical protein
MPNTAMPNTRRKMAFVDGGILWALALLASYSERSRSSYGAWILSIGRCSIVTSAIDRSAASRALAKAIAYHKAGKAEMAKEWAQHLVAMLRDAGIEIS